MRLFIFRSATFFSSERSAKTVGMSDPPTDNATTVGMSQVISAVFTGKIGRGSTSVDWWILVWITLGGLIFVGLAIYLGWYFFWRDYARRQRERRTSASDSIETEPVFSELLAQAAEIVERELQLEHQREFVGIKREKL